MSNHASNDNGPSPNNSHVAIDDSMEMHHMGASGEHPDLYHDMVRRETDIASEAEQKSRKRHIFRRLLRSPKSTISRIKKLLKKRVHQSPVPSDEETDNARALARDSKSTKLYSSALANSSKTLTRSRISDEHKRISDPEQLRAEPRSVEIIRVVSHNSQEPARRARANTAGSNNTARSSHISALSNDNMSTQAIPEETEGSDGALVAPDNVNSRRVANMKYPDGNDEVVEPTNEDEEGRKRASTVVCRYGEGIDEVIGDEPVPGKGKKKRPSTWAYGERKPAEEVTPAPRKKRPETWAFGESRDFAEVHAGRRKKRVSRPDSGVGLCRWGDGASEHIPSYIRTQGCNHCLYSSMREQLPAVSW